MSETNFYTDITGSVNTIFSFLQTEFHFSEFKEEQIAYEMHLKASSALVLIDIWFEAISSTPIWAKINEYYIDNLEPDNPLLKHYSDELYRLYSEPPQPLPEVADKCLEYEHTQYQRFGKSLNDSYLTELSNILKRHPEVFLGDFERLESNTEAIIKANQQFKNEERIEKGIYTLEFQLFCEDEYDMYVEFDTLDEVRKYLSEDHTIKIYRVLDCFMNELPLP